MKKHFVKFLSLVVISLALSMLPQESSAQMYSPYVAMKEYFKRICRLRIYYGVYDPRDGQPYTVLRKEGSFYYKGTWFEPVNKMPLVMTFEDGSQIWTDFETGEELYIPPGSVLSDSDYQSLWEQAELEVLIEDGAFV